MGLPFVVPRPMLGRFGVVKLWPDLKVAEDEVIARLRNTARALGLECVVVDNLARTIDPPHRQMTRDDLDFVIHLHFSTPKSYDIFSFVVLWNPLQFYHDFGYRPMARNLLSHDDFLSCSSPAADDQIRRLIARDPTRDEARFTMYHSLSEPVLPPTKGEGKLFYSGINWDRLGKGKSRHQSVLDELDLTGLLRIYGPRVLRGVRVWEGYDSYQGSLPFDGVTTIREIHRAGICLVLSSDAHKDAALMSNRLFEALAAGAVIICDENAFARTHFGNTLLYVDMRDEPSDVAERIIAHARWVEANPAEAVAMAAAAQAIFRERFSLDLSLRQIYDGFAERRAEVEALYAPADAEKAVELLMLAPVWDRATFEQHARSAGAQRYGNCRPTLVVDEFDLHHFGEEIRAAAASTATSLAVRGAPFFGRNSRGKAVRRNRIGAVLHPFLTGLDGNALCCVVGPNETLLDNHLTSLVGALARAPDVAYAFSGISLKHENAAGEVFCDVQDSPDLLSSNPHAAIGLGRFLFRAGAVRDAAAVLLPYLDVKAAAGLAFHARGVPTGRPTAILDIQHEFYLRARFPDAAGKSPEAAVREELDVLRDLNREAFDRAEVAQHAGAAAPPAPAVREVVTVERAVENPLPASLYLDRLSTKNRQVLMVQLLQSLPLPSFVWKAIRPLRPWRSQERPAAIGKDD